MNKREERLRLLAAGAQNRMSSRLGDIWWAFMLRGMFAGVLGVCAFIWPTLSFTILTRLVGLYLRADGLPGLMGALRASASGTYLLQAIVSLVAGGVLLFLPSASARTLLMVFGVWALFTGVSHILATRQANVENIDRGPMTTMGAVLFAALLIFVALRLKRLKKRVDELVPLRSTE